MKTFTKTQRIMLLFAAVLFMMGVVSMRLNAGTLLLWVMAAVIAITVMLQKRTGRKHRVLGFVSVLIIVGLAAHAALWNYFVYCRPPKTQGEATVIVLGCKVNGDEPSLMLKRRLLKAKEYLDENPQADCVVSGGLGEGEEYTESEVMKQFLVKNGIDEGRIFEENRSTNTDTNIRYSQQVIEREDLSDSLVICTDGFHQLRAWMYVRRNGMDAAAISGRTSIWVIPSYAMRELAGIFKMLIIG